VLSENSQFGDWRAGESWEWACWCEPKPLSIIDQ
jgi:hypothetical protein